MRPALVPVIRVLLPHPVRPADILDEPEGPRPQHVLLVPARIGGEALGLVDPVPGRGQARDEGALVPLQAEHHGVGRRRLHRLHRPVLLLAARHHALGREDDVVVGGLHVPRGEEAPVVELHALPDLEGERALVGGRRPGLGEVAHELRAGAIGGVHPQEQVVVGRARMEHRERLFPVRVEAGWFRGHHEDELASGARLVLAGGGRQRAEADEDQEGNEDRRRSGSARGHGLPPVRGERCRYDTMRARGRETGVPLA